jgi:hypothetical protein
MPMDNALMGVSYWAALRRLDWDYACELQDMIVNCADPFLRRELIRKRDDFIETAADADRSVREIEAALSGAMAAPPRARRPLAIVARRA